MHKLKNSKINENSRKLWLSRLQQHTFRICQFVPFRRFKGFYNFITVFNGYFQDMAIRTMSLPRRNHYDDEDSGFIRSNGSKNHPESFSLHGTLKRNGSSHVFNSTLEDEVFEDSISAPNSAKPLLHDKPLFPHLYTSFGKSKFRNPAKPGNEALLLRNSFQKFR